jgi:hypothetical protein
MSLLLCLIACVLLQSSSAYTPPAIGDRIAADVLSAAHSVCHPKSTSERDDLLWSRAQVDTLVYALLCGVLYDICGVLNGVL